MNRRQFLNSAASCAFLPSFSLAPRPAWADYVTYAAIINGAKMAQNLFGSGGGGDIAAAYARANFEMLRALGEQISNIQRELKNVAIDLQSIIGKLNNVDIVVESTSRENDLLTRCASINEIRGNIENIRDLYGPRANVDAYLHDLLSNFLEFKNERNSLLETKEANSASRSLHIVTASALELSTISFLANFDLSTVSSEPLNIALARDWSVDLTSTCLAYKSYFDRMWKEDDLGEIQIALKKAKDSFPIPRGEDTYQDGAILLHSSHCYAVETYAGRKWPTHPEFLKGSIYFQIHAYEYTTHDTTIEIYNKINPDELPGIPIPHLRSSPISVVERGVAEEQKMAFRGGFGSPRLFRQGFEYLASCSKDVTAETYLQTMQALFREVFEVRMMELSLSETNEAVHLALQSVEAALRSLGVNSDG